MLEARDWLRSHGYAGDGKVHVTRGYLRFRQVMPIFSRYKTVVGGDGILLVVPY